MSDNLDRYVPEFDEEETRSKLAGLTREQLTDMLVYAYKLRRVIEKWADADAKKLDRIRNILAEPSPPPGMPGIPTAEDLRRMLEDNAG
jgi:hypothetical protein